ncbi:N-acetylmuramoyl-L-alanine amidase family protein [Gracilinema caldarium]|uniref:N-acetylmuramoyl-L-alanine amidase n=1 Tax=Gracilinema caldarium (strain ATCC 51460 / DSM 7334 / H1) TaxID=744872 RepID=F8F0R8_GRAC1|nr:N-acetylmuramoyl-L-alanine amidase [Gracilinema caldarium]AEJ19775.1 cell wall hydrolase/autolysin [Gracilinema caldarium DSM 7334]
MDRRLSFKKYIVFLILLFISSFCFADDIELSQALSRLSAKLSWDPLMQTGLLITDLHHISFGIGYNTQSSPFIIDNRYVLYLPSPRYTDSRLVFPSETIEGLEKALLSLLSKSQALYRIAAIVIDPGHGGKDSGAVAEHLIEKKKVTLQEKNITLSVGKQVYELLKTQFPEKRILMTRTGDTYPTLEDRVSIANAIPLGEHEAILFISIHTNASFNKTARGYEVWYLSPEYRRTLVDSKKFQESTEVLPIINAMLEEEFTTESILLAQSILSQLDVSLGDKLPSRGIKAEEWFVVRNAKMPSVLVELGFITNYQDAILMNDSAYLQKFSNALYKGIVDFVNNFEKTGGFTTAP